MTKGKIPFKPLYGSRELELTKQGHMNEYDLFHIKESS